MSLLTELVALPVTVSDKFFAPTEPVVGWRILWSISLANYSLLNCQRSAAAVTASLLFTQRHRRTVHALLFPCPPRTGFLSLFQGGEMILVQFRPDVMGRRIRERISFQ
jgi:hypothetical protein